jgi:ABC-type transport system involved in multi-copper enzyme maturation permease subunit
MIKADFLERTRRTSFLLTLCLVIYLGFEVNTGQILIKLQNYRGVYNSAWVGSLMAIVITFFLGVIGFFLVKNTIERDERSGVGQIIATTSLSRVQYLMGKWLSNFAVLGAMVGILTLAAILMQIIYHEDGQVQVGALIAPLFFVALPMMAFVAALAVFFESVNLLKGGFGNLVYFGLFTTLLFASLMLPQFPILDVAGFSLIGSSMKIAAKTAFPTYDGTFVLSMISDQPLDTFYWGGVNWTIAILLQRLMGYAVSLGIVLLSALFFNRFDRTQGAAPRRVWFFTDRKPSLLEAPQIAEKNASPDPAAAPRLTPLATKGSFHPNLLRLIWMECKLLLKGAKWYWTGGMAALWLGCVFAPTRNLRQMAFMLVVLLPVLLWSKMGQREVQHHAEPLVFQVAYPLARLLSSSWLAGVFFTAIAASGALFGRALHAEPLALLPWVLSVCFIPTLALMLGIWSRSSKMFEVVYAILWYLGPFNPQNGLTVLDFLGIHERASVNSSPLLFSGVVFLLILAAWVGRKRQLQV